MKLRCKVGDDAIVIDAVHIDDIGLIVKIIEYDGLHFDRHAWVAKSIYGTGVFF